MTPTLKKYDIAIDELRKIFNEYYDQTKRIVLSSERLSDTTDIDVFYDLSRILDEIYLMMEIPEADNIKKRIRYIKGQFIAAQNYSITFFVPRIKSDLNKHNIKNSKIDRIIKEMIEFLIDNKLANKNSKVIFFKKLKLGLPGEEEIENAQKINNGLVDFFKNIIEALIPDWDLLGENYKFPKRQKKKLKGFTFEEKLVDTFIEYNFARTVLIDILTRQGRHYSFAINDLRDALDHLNKSFDIRNDALVELSFANEHIRRSAMESLQTYVKSQLDDKCANLATSGQLEKNIKNIMLAKKEICVGRNIKADSTWYYAVDNFYNALKYVNKCE